MGINWKLRGQYLHDTQLRKSRGLIVVGIVALLSLIGLYDLGVAQLAEDTSRWLSVRDVFRAVPLWVWPTVGLGVICVALFEGSFRAWDKQRQALDVLTTPVLKMWHEASGPPNSFTQHFSPSGHILFRIAIQGPQRTIHGVKVSLKQFWPQGGEFFPLPLAPMNVWPEGLPTFTLNPGIPTYVEVIRWVPEFQEFDAPRPVFMVMYFNRQTGVSVIECREYRFRLVAEGIDVPPSETDFEVILDSENKPVFRQLKDALSPTIFGADA